MDGRPARGIGGSGPDDIERQSLLTGGQPPSWSVTDSRLDGGGGSPFGADERHVVHSNHTITTKSTSDTPITPKRAGSVGRPRLRTLVGGVVAVGGLTFGIGAALAQESTVQVNPAVVDHAEIAEMARANGLTGLSPASLVSSSPARSDAALAEWARANGMTGLSPASLASTAAAWYGDDAAIADWARSNGLTGLSPASLAPVAD